MSNLEPLRVTLGRLTSSEAVVHLVDSDQELVLPRRILPKVATVGDEYILELTPATEAAERRDTVARKLLEDILNGK